MGKMKELGMDQQYDQTMVDDECCMYCGAHEGDGPSDRPVLEYSNVHQGLICYWCRDDMKEGRD